MGNLQHLTLLFNCNFGPDLAALLNRPVYMFTSFISKMLTGCANMYKVLASPVVSNCARSSNTFRTMPVCNVAVFNVTTSWALDVLKVDWPFLALNTNPST